MGYTTTFEGSFKLDRALKPEHRAYLLRFSETRRMQRNGEKLRGAADPLRVAVGLDVGTEGEFYVGDPDEFGQSQTSDILDYNRAPRTQPGLWCKWEPSEDGTEIKWSGAEKFYDYIEWLDYLIRTFLSKWGYSLNGKVTWEGEDRGDYGTIIVLGNTVSTVR